MLILSVNNAFSGSGTFVLLAALLAAAAAILHLVGCLTCRRKLCAITKPMLMPAVILLHISLCGFAHPLVIAALVFGCVGDVLLMYVSKNNAFLVGGMASFLVGHVLYIVSAFLTGYPSALGGAWKIALIFLCAFALGAAAYLFLFKRIGKELKLPAAVYIFALTAMAASMFCCFFGGMCTPTALLACGGALFALSDFILSCSLFGVTGRPRINFAVMLTYIGAQTCLAVGFALVGAAA